MTEHELSRLLYVAIRRPLAEYGRQTRHQTDTGNKNRKKWTKEPLTFDTIDAAGKRATARLQKNRAFVARLEHLGWERALLYKTLVLTGLRKSELASITVAQLQLDGPYPHIELQASADKSREGAQLPLRRDLASDLDSWLASKHEGFTGVATVARDCHHFKNSPVETPLFTVPSGLIRILDRDLKAARIPKRDERGRTIDVHALRHSFGTLLSKGGVAPRTAQAVMRHSEIGLTMNVYTDPKLLDVHGAVEALPELPLNGGVSDQGIQQATGTDRTSTRFAPGFAPNLCKPSQSRSSADKQRA
jgi:integrase